MYIRNLLLPLLLLDTACSDASRSAARPRELFPSVEGVNFPIRGAHPTAMNTVLAFPSLRFSAPVFLTHAPDNSDRLFVVEKRGRIQVFPNEELTTQRNLFLDIQGRVNDSAGEEGLLGLAFHPNYAQNGSFYVFYCYKPATQRYIRVSRFKVNGNDPNQADANSEVVLLTVAQPYANHNGGMLAFGPDGYLYASLGDGGSSGDPHDHAQNLSTPLGSILRIDVDRTDPGLQYAIPHSNPFVSVPGARGEIWANGLRNPWRFSFDRNTGTLWAGDVGQTTREEVDIIVKGGNYGWRFREGFAMFAGTPPPNFVETKPILDYSRAEARSIIGGYVYRGTAVPELRGAYLHADYLSASIWALVYQNQQIVSNQEIATLGRVSTFGEDMHGEVYVVDYRGWIYSLVPATGTTTPALFPKTLSETGLFDNVLTLDPNPNLVPYEVTEPLWSDNAVKRNWVGVPIDPAAIGWTDERDESPVSPEPRSSQPARIVPESPYSGIRFDPTDPWEIPMGSVVVKHFELPTNVTNPTPTTRLETRVLVHEEGGWQGYTYRWNDQGTEAHLLQGTDTRDITIIDPGSPGGMRTQTWQFPGRANCLECHTTAGKRVLGLNTRQINHKIDYGPPIGTRNQLKEMTRRGLFGMSSMKDPSSFGRQTASTDTGPTKESRVRSYLAVNCAHCHQPDGDGSGLIDLRLDTPLVNTGLINALPQHGDLGIPGARIIAPRNRNTSILYQRIQRLDQYRMPPLGSHLVDGYFLALLGQWIDTL